MVARETKGNHGDGDNAGWFTERSILPAGVTGIDVKSGLTRPHNNKKN